MHDIRIFWGSKIIGQCNITVNWSVIPSSKKQEAPTKAPSDPHLLTVTMLMSKPSQAIQFTGEHTETWNMPWASPSRKNTFIIVFPNTFMIAQCICPLLYSESSQETCGKFNTGLISGSIVCMFQIHGKWQIGSNVKNTNLSFKFGF